MERYIVRGTGLPRGKKGGSATEMASGWARVLHNCLERVRGKERDWKRNAGVERKKNQGPSGEPGLEVVGTRVEDGGAARCFSRSLTGGSLPVSIGGIYFSKGLLC